MRVNFKQLPLFTALLTLSVAFGYYLQVQWDMARLPAYSLSTTLVVQASNLYNWITENPPTSNSIKESVAIKSTGSGSRKNRRKNKEKATGSTRKID
jgi:hypothetical protein